MTGFKFFCELTIELLFVLKVLQDFYWSPSESVCTCFAHVGIFIYRGYLPLFVLHGPSRKKKKTEIPSAVYRAVLSPEHCPTSACCKYPRKYKKMP